MFENFTNQYQLSKTLRFELRPVGRTLEYIEQKGLTDQIDPATGFVNLFDTRYTSVEKAKEFFGKFKSISYNKSKGYFEFAFDYNDFTTKAWMNFVQELRR